MFTKQTIKDLDLNHKTVLLRADYNVPLAGHQITDDYRIKQSLPTINYLLDQQVKLVICAHLGRPDGRVDSALSLKPVAEHLSKLLNKKVEFVNNCVGEVAEGAVKALKPGQILLLENLRFYPQEEANDENFAKQLASLAEVYVDDAFGAAHRAHASIVGVTKFLPSVAGLLLAKEVEVLTSVMDDPDRPLSAIVGGAKVEDKLEILSRFVRHANFLAIGGALANPFLHARGIKLGDSLYDPTELKLAKQILAEAEEETKKRNFIFYVPHDAVVAREAKPDAKTRVVDFSSNSFADIEHYPAKVPETDIRLTEHDKILDIGPFSASFISGAIQLSKTVIWNGTMGITEVKGLQGPIGPFAHGTETLIEAITGEFGHKPYSVVGGGDTVGYLESRKLLAGFDHVSTGGGASLELMSGHKLPGVEALMDKK